jgi:S1-C subfamily serine protease
MTFDKRQNGAVAACAACAAAVFQLSPLQLPPALAVSLDTGSTDKLLPQSPVAHRPASAEFGPPLQAPKIPAPGRPDLENIHNAAKSVVTVNLDGSLGSGFIIKYKDSYYVVTNAHVVGQSSPEDIEVTLYDGSVVLVDKVRSDPLADIAILRLKGDGYYPTSKLGDSDKISPGEKVFAIGAPLGFPQTITSGIVSGMQRDFSNRGVQTVFGLIQTDSPLNSGNSGGPLIDEDGTVIGINSNLIGNTNGLGFSIPINEANSVISQLIENGVAVHGYLGAHIVTPTRTFVSVVTKPLVNGAEPLVPSWVPEARRRVGEHSALVLKVEPKSPAARAGIRAGDFIVGINGQRIVGDGNARSLIAQTRPGQPVVLDIVRIDPNSGEFLSLKLSVKLGERSSPQGKPFLATLPSLQHLTSNVTSGW